MKNEANTAALDVLELALRCCWREWIFCAPIGWLLSLGCRDAPFVAYADCMTSLVFLALVLNPLRLIGRIAAPGTRGLLAAAIASLWTAVRLPWLSKYFRVCLIVLAILTAFSAVWTAPAWLLSYKVRQSDAVDKVLSYLTHGDEFAASEAWNRYGCRETRALLHQAVGMECPEPLVCSSYKAAYLLGFLHGSVELEAVTGKLVKTTAMIKRLQKDKERLENQLAWIRQAETERTEKERMERDNYYQQRETPPKVEMTEEEKDAEIMKYLDAGHSYGDTAKKFGVSKSTAHKAAQRARERLDEEQQVQEMQVQRDL